MAARLEIDKMFARGENMSRAIEQVAQLGFPRFPLQPTLGAEGAT